MDAHILEVTRDELAPPTPGRHRVALPGEADASGHAEIPAQGVTGAAATKASDTATLGLARDLCRNPINGVGCWEPLQF